MEIKIKDTARSDRGWCKPSVGAKYASQSLKGFRTWFGNGLRHVRLPNGRILTRYEWIDNYLEQFEVKGTNHRKLINDILKDF